MTATFYHKAVFIGSKNLHMHTD